LSLTADIRLIPGKLIGQSVGGLSARVVAASKEQEEEKGGFGHNVNCSLREPITYADDSVIK
jgi:hypothetical protein